MQHQLALFLATWLALAVLAQGASTKLNDRLLCETCHALGNDVVLKLLKVPGAKTDAEVQAYLAGACAPETLEGFSINPQVLAHACENLLEHHYSDVYQALTKGFNEYELCHVALPVCKEIDYSRPGYEDAATLTNKLRKRIKLVLDLTVEPSEEIIRRVPNDIIIASKEAAKTAQEWYKINIPSSDMETLHHQLHLLTIQTHFIHDVYESMQKRKEFHLFLNYKIAEIQNNPLVSDIEGGSTPFELKLAKEGFLGELKQAQAWLNHPDNTEKPYMEYSTYLAQLRNDGVKIELNTYNGYYDKLKEKRLAHDHQAKKEL